MNWRKFSSLIFAAVILLSLLPAVGLAQDSGSIPTAMAEIDAALLDALSAEGSADFFVVMAEKADLSAAFEIEEWSARGWYVYNALREVAAKSQALVIKYAEANSLDYQSFFTKNAVYIKGGNLEAVEGLAALPGVSYLRLEGHAQIDPNAKTEAGPRGAEAYGWNLDTLDPGSNLYGNQAAAVWDQYGVRGEGIVVANIDTGAYYEHEALVEQYRGNLGGGSFDHDFNWYMPTSGCGDGTYPCDNDGHGSGTMGIMAGQTADLTEQIGVAPGAEWIACKGCEGISCSDAALTGCADWLVAPCPIGAAPGDPACDPNMRPHIINNSWGGTGCDLWYQGYIQAWVAAGQFPAFSAGNSAACGSVGAPGDTPEAFGTAAHDSSGGNLYAGGPSCHFPDPSCDPDAHEVDPHLNAPTYGRSADNAQGLYFNIGGTSGASPHTGGVVALIWSANPGYMGDIYGTYTILEQSTNHDVPAGTCGKPACAGANVYPNYEYGWGYLDALAAVEMAGVGGQGALNGTVTEAAPLDAPGDPLEGMTVTADRMGGGGRSTTTNAAGYYTMTLSFGTYTVTVEGPQYTGETVYGIVVTTDTITTQDFGLDPQGLLDGYVTDADSSAPLEATVTADDGTSALTNPATGYYSMYLDAGIYDVTAEETDYASQTVSINMPTGGHLVEDFALVAAIAVVPEQIAISVELGQTGDTGAEMTNNMVVDYDFSFVEAPPSASTTMAGEDILVVYDLGRDAADAFELALDNLGYTWLEVTAAEFVAMTVPDLLAYQAVIYVGYPSGTEQDQCMGYMDAGGSFLVADNDLGYYQNSSTLYQTYLQANYVSDAGSDGVLTGLDIMAGINPDISADPYPDDFTGGAEGVGIFEAPSGNLAGIRVERASYKAIYLAWDYNYIGSSTPGDPEETTILDAALGWLAGGDIPWFGTSITDGTVLAGQSLAWTNYFTATPATGVEFPGEYHARLRIRADSPALPNKDVAVVLTVLPTATMGKLEGTVTSDRPGGALEATILMTDTFGVTWTTTSDLDTGYYQYWLEEGSYDVEASAPGYVAGIENPAITAGFTTTQDFELALDAPWVDVAPDWLETTLDFGDTDTLALQIDNLSDYQPLEWEIVESDRGMTPLAASIALVSDGTQLTAITPILDGMGLGYDVVNNNDPNYFMADPGFLSQYSLIVWYASGASNFGRAITQAEHDATEVWLQAGGNLLVTGYDTIGSPDDPLLADLIRSSSVGDGPFSGDYSIVLDHPITNGPFGVYPPGTALTADSTDHDRAEADTARGAVTVAQFTSDPDDKIMAAEIPGGGRVVYWNGNSNCTDWLVAASSEAPQEDKGIVVEAPLSPDSQEGQNMFKNTLTWLYASDVPWLSTDPISGTIGTNGSQAVDVHFDAGVVPEPGIYQADLRVRSDDPLNGSVTIPVTMTVNPTADIGKLEGTVTSDRPGDPLAATITITSSGGLTWTVDTDPATGYYYRWLAIDTYEVTASSPGHLPGTATGVVIVGMGTTTQDFVLTLFAPDVDVSPTSLETTLTFGGADMQNVTIYNYGVAPLDWEYQEVDRGLIPLIEIAPFEGTLPESTAPLSFERAPGVSGPLAEPTGLVFAGSPASGVNLLDDSLYNWADVDVPGTWNMAGSMGAGSYYAGDFAGADFATLYVIDNDTQTLFAVDTATGAKTSIGPSPSLAGQTWTGLAWDATTATMYGSATDGVVGTLFTVNLGTGATTEVGTITGFALTIDIAVNGSGQMYGVDIGVDQLIEIDKATGAATAVGATGYDANYAQGLDFDESSGVLYWAAYGASGELRIIDTSTGASALVGAFPNGDEVDSFAIQAGGGGEVPWLSQVPVSGRVPAFDDVMTEIHFDSGVVPEPGTYLANLNVASNDPFDSPVTVQVTMTVLPSADLGKLDGTIDSLGYCDAYPEPLEADVTIEDGLGGSWQVSSDPVTGYYYRWLVAGTYTVTAGAPEHVPAEAVVTVAAGYTTTQDLDLRYVESCLDWTPPSFSVTMPQDSQQTETLTILNDGAGDLLWEIKETTRTVTIVSIPPFEGDVPADAAPHSMERAPDAPVPNGSAAAALPWTLAGAPAYALDVYPGYNMVYFPDTAAPGSWNIVGSVTQFHPAGDFLGGDFTKMYALDYDTNEFVTLDTSNGTRTVIGTSVPTGNWSGMAGAPDGTLYAASSVCGTTSYLYTIDPASGAPTPVGEITGAACIIDIAVNAQGEMYGVDIITDNLIRIDTTTGAGTIVGYTGVAANYAQGMDFDEDSGILYWAAYTTAGEMRILDTTTGMSTLVGAFPGGAEVDCLSFATGGGSMWNDVPWVSEVPTAGMVYGDDAFDVDVIFDTTGLTAGECYTANLGLLHDDPGWESPSYIPLELCVEACEPITSMDLTVLTADPVVGEPVQFEVDMGPGSMSVPYAYTIEFGDGQQVSGSSMDVTHGFSHTYVSEGDVTVIFEAQNCGMTEVMSDTVQVTISAAMNRYYLPIIVMND